MRILVFEPFRGGHHTNYLEALLPRLIARKADGAVSAVMVVLSRSHAESAGMRCILDGVRGEIDVFLLDRAVDASLPFRERLTLARELGEAIDVFSPDGVVLTSGDSETLLASLRPATRIHRLAAKAKIVALVHNGYAGLARSRKDRVKGAIYDLALSRAPWHRVMLVNPLQFEHASSTLKRRDLLLLPDPVERPSMLDRATAREKLGLPMDGLLIGHVGAVDERKAILPLVQAFADVARADERLLLAGPQPAALRETLERDHAALIAGGQLIVRDGFLAEDELWWALAALDVVAPLHWPRPELSANYLKAVVAGRPVLVDSFGYTGAMTQRFDLGVAVPVHDQAALAAGMRRVLDSAAGWVAPPAVAELAAFHDPDNFAAAILDALGVDPGFARAPWPARALEPA